MRPAVAVCLLALICAQHAAAPEASFQAASTSRAAAQPRAGTSVATSRGDVSARRIRADVEFLASDLMEGREAGTRGYDLAALYAATQLRLAGWEPAADDGSYFQQVPLLERTAGSASLTLRPANAGAPVSIRIPEEAVVAASGERVDLTAPVVFAGYGVVAPEQKYDDYAGLDVKGRFVAVLYNAPGSFPSEPRAHYASTEEKIRTAAERGAIGLITVLTKADLAMFPWPAVIESFAKPGVTWVRPDGSPGTRDPRIAAGALMNAEGAARLVAAASRTFEEAAAAAAKGRAGGFPLETSLTLSATATHRRLTSPNVVARLPGSDPAVAGTAVLVSAHLDHTGERTAGEGDRIFNGAYDNAVGCAIVLDVARALAVAPRPRRSVVVALVTAEESGLVGSDYLARHVPRAAGTFVANVNLDMPLLLTASRDLVAFGAENSTLESIVREVATAVGYTLSPDPMPEQNLFVRSDQYSFVRQGVPAVYLMPGFTARDAAVNGQQLFSDFLARHYHQVSDDLSRPMDLGALERFARANLHLVRRIADARRAPSWKPGNFFGRTFGK